MIPNTKFTHSEVIEQLRRNPNAQPTTEQMNVMLFGELNTFERALAEMKSLLTLQQGQSLLTDYTSNFNRMEALLRLARRMPHETFLTLLGEHWSGSDFVFEQRYELKHVLRDIAKPARLMMTDEELAKYEELPDAVTCFRGAAPDRLDGICWSLERDIANSFPYLCWYDSSSSKPVLATGEVAKEDILAVKLDRNEAEIISFDVRVLKAEATTEATAKSFLRRRSLGFNFHSEMASLAAYIHRSNIAHRDVSVGSAVLNHLLNAAESLALMLQDEVDNEKHYVLFAEIENVLDEMDRTELELLARDPFADSLAV